MTPTDITAAVEIDRLDGAIRKSDAISRDLHRRAFRHRPMISAQAAHWIAATAIVAGLLVVIGVSV